MDIYTYSQIYTMERMKLHIKPFQSWVWEKFLSQVEADTGVPDVIHVHYPANITIADNILAYQVKGTRVICTEHWTQVLNEIIDKYERSQLALYASYADAFLCVGAPLRDAVYRITKTTRKIYVVPNMVNSIFKPGEAEEDTFDFIAVGVLFPHKQFDKIIEAFSKQFKGEKTRLIIVGGGPEFYNLKKTAKRAGIEQQVVFTGKLTREETAKRVRNSNVLICYSTFETFGVPVIEAWTCGLPVIASTATAVRDGWDSRLGEQVSPKDVTDLQNAMQYVYDNILNYDRTYIIKYANEHYSEETVYGILMQYYKANNEK